MSVFGKNVLYAIACALLLNSVSLYSKFSFDQFRLPSPVPCNSILSLLSMLSTEIDTCCTTLNNGLDEALQRVQTITVSPCNFATPITQADIPLTINTSGVYCLAENVSTAAPNRVITINADDVTIDLNGFVVSGGQNAIEVSNNHTNIMLMNGVIQNATPNGTDNGRGVFANNTTTIVLKNLILQGNLVGALFVDSEGVFIDNCTVVGNTGMGITLANSRNARVVQSIVRNNNFSSTITIPGLGAGQVPRGCGVFFSSNCSFIETRLNDNQFTATTFNWSALAFETCNDCLVEGCSANNNINPDATFGSVGYDFSESSNCVIKNSEANNNTFGSRILNANNIIFKKCSASENRDGFTITQSSGCCFIECLAKANTNRGFVVVADNGLILNCRALGNNNGFFFDPINANSLFFGNYAEGNSNDPATNNYVGLGGDRSFTPLFEYDLSTGVYAPLAPRAGNPTKWDNISAIPTP